MLRKAGLLCAALAMFSIAGGHWAVLQTVAWTRMLADYSRASGSVVTALAQTFDGEHPCRLCQEIAAAKGGEQRRPETSAAAAAQKFKAGKGDVIGVAVDEAGLHPAGTLRAAGWFAAAPAVLTPRGEAPPVPPPRSPAA